MSEDLTVIRVKSTMKKEDYESLADSIRQQAPNVIVIPCNAELVTPTDRPQEWIPCSERLPEEEGIYLVTATNFIFNTEEIAVGTCYFNIEYGFSNNRKILAWMPLPKPWKGADDEAN